MYIYIYMNMHIQQYIKGWPATFIELKHTYAHEHCVHCCIYIFMHIYTMYTVIYKSSYMYVYIYIYMYVYIYTYTYIYIYIYICIYIYTYIYISIASYCCDVFL